MGTRSTILSLLLLLLIPLAATAQTGDVIFQDDGSGFDPVTGQPNNWQFNPGDWAFTTAQGVAADPDFAGSQAAADLVTALGATNAVMVNKRDQNDALPFEPIPIEIVALSLTSNAGRNFGFDFEQANLNPLVGIPGGDVAAYVVDDLAIQLDDIGPGAMLTDPSIFVWIWVHMYVIVIVHQPEVVKVTHADCKGPEGPDGKRGPPCKFVTTVVVTPAMDVPVLVDLSAHYHAVFSDADVDDPGPGGPGSGNGNGNGGVDAGDIIGVRSIATVARVLPVPAVDRSLRGALALALVLLGATAATTRHRRGTSAGR